MLPGWEDEVQLVDLFPGNSSFLLWVSIYSHLCAFLTLTLSHFLHLSNFSWNIGTDSWFFWSNTRLSS